MSLSYNPLKTVNVLDPRIAVEKERSWAMVKGGSQVSYKTFSTTSYSTNQFSFSCPPPSGNMFVDRNILLRTTVEITITGTNAVPDALLLQNGYFALRKNPLTKCMNNIQSTINNSQSTIQIGDIISGMERAHAYPKELEYVFGLTPSMPDSSQEYNDVTTSMNNPLSPYFDGIHGTSPRGGFPMTIVSNTETSAVIRATVTEPIYLSPFLWSTEGPGLFNVQNMDFTFNFGTNLGYGLLSHNDADQSTWTNVSVNFISPVLLLTYITPKPTMKIPPQNLVYPYYVVNRFPTGPVNVASNATTAIASANVNLSTIPRRIYIWAREDNNSLTPESTDTFASISNINVQFGSYDSQLASASQQELWNISRKHGLSMSWTEFSGGPVVKDVAVPSYMGTVGSVIILEPGIDFGLSDLEIAGLSDKITLQITATIKNCNQSRAVNYTLFLVTIDEGTMTIPSYGSSVTQIGVVTPADIVNSINSPTLSYADVSALEGGTFMGSGLRDKISAFFRTRFLPIAKEVLQNTGRYAVDEISNAVRNNVRPRGSALVGGKHINRNDLRK